MDDNELDEKDNTKRQVRNLSEKKRRDQFNKLITELHSMLSTGNRKMDKSTVLKSTINFLKTHNEFLIRSQMEEIEETWKPSFLSNDEFFHLMLEALGGFIMMLSREGKILYVSENIAALLGYLPSDVLDLTLYDIVHEVDQTRIYNILSSCPVITAESSVGNHISFSCYIRRKNLTCEDLTFYEHVKVFGSYQQYKCQDAINIFEMGDELLGNKPNKHCTMLNLEEVFVAMVCLQASQLIQELYLMDSFKNEFMSRHSMEWKFLFLDHRAPPIVGYLPFEVLGTSCYDYIHYNELPKIIECHQALLQTGEGTSCYYRFLTKGQQWIWIQTRYYITYHQWNAKPEFIVCTHNVISYTDVVQYLRKTKEKQSSAIDDDKLATTMSHEEHSSNNDQTSQKKPHSPHSTISPYCKSPSVCSRKSAEMPTGTNVSTSGVQHGINFISPNSLPQVSSTATLRCEQQSFTHLQALIEEQLRKKHQALQKEILHQQEELRKVHQQLMLAQFVPQVVQVMPLQSYVTSVPTMSPTNLSTENNEASVLSSAQPSPHENEVSRSFPRDVADSSKSVINSVISE